MGVWWYCTDIFGYLRSVPYIRSCIAPRSLPTIGKPHLVTSLIIKPDVCKYYQQQAHNQPVLSRLLKGPALIQLAKWLIILERS